MRRGRDTVSSLEFDGSQYNPVTPGKMKAPPMPRSEGSRRNAEVVRLEFEAATNPHVCQRGCVLLQRWVTMYFHENKG